MASYLRPCGGGCGSVLRSMTPFTEPGLCDSCRPRVEAAEARAQKEAEDGVARILAAEEKRLAARAADKNARADAAAKADAQAKAAVPKPKAAVKEPPKRPGRFSRK